MGRTERETRGGKKDRRVGILWEELVFFLFFSFYHSSGGPSEAPLRQAGLATVYPTISSPAGLRPVLLGTTQSDLVHVHSSLSLSVSIVAVRKDVEYDPM